MDRNEGENAVRNEIDAAEEGGEREAGTRVAFAPPEQETDPDEIVPVDLGGESDFSATAFDAEMHPMWLQKLLSREDTASFHDKAKTQVWTSRLTYILAAVGSAVGLGNIWRFPFLCYRNGGATFLIPYLLSLVFLGIPLLVLEMAIGQGTGKGAVAAFASFNPRYKGLGWCSFVSGAGIVTYYCVVLAWCARYLVAALSSIGGRLPWQGGRSSQYFQSTVMSRIFLCRTNEAAKLDVPALVCNSSVPMSYADMMEVTDLAGEDQFLPCVCNGAAFAEQGHLQGTNVAYLLGIWAVVLLMCCLGTRSLKWAVYVTVPLPYVMLVLIFLRGITLDGASTGLKYYLQPDMNRLFQDYVDPVSGEVSSPGGVWLDAATQIFFSLSLGQGAMITYASYNPPHFPIVRNAITIALVNSATEFFAGMCVFSILGYLAESRGLPIQDVVAAGPGLVFEVIPEALSLMPFAGVFSVMFFVMLLMLGLTSAVSLVEGCIAILRDFAQEAGHGGGIEARPWALPVLMCTSCCLLGLLFCRASASDWVALIDEFTSNMLLTTVGLGEFLLVGWIVGGRDFSVLTEQRLGWKLTSFWLLVWRFIGPGALSLLMLAGWIATVTNPPVSEPWALAIGWMMAGVPLSVAVVIYLTAQDHEGAAFSLVSCVRGGGRPDKELLELRRPGGNGEEGGGGAAAGSGSGFGEGEGEGVAYRSRRAGTEHDKTP